MKALALYGSTRPSKDGNKISVNGKPYYVRAEVITKRGRPSKHFLADALLLAKPRRGEVLLNTVRAPH